MKLTVCVVFAQAKCVYSEKETLDKFDKAQILWGCESVFHKLMTNKEGVFNNVMIYRTPMY